MNKKILGIIIGIIILIIIIACSVGFVIIHKQNEELQQAKLEQQKIEQQMQADQAKAKAQAEQEAKEKQAEQEAKEKQAAKEANEKAQSGNQTTQTDRKQMNSLNDTKAQFLNEMDNLKVANPFPGGHLGQVTQQDLLYQAWDAELNKIWGVLKNMLPSSEMASLTKDEQAWIQSKEQYQAGYNQGELAPTQALAQMTKERCYYLVNNYM